MDEIYDKLVDLQICPRDIWSDMRDEVRSMCDEVYSAKDSEFVFLSTWADWAISESYPQ